MEHRCVWGVSTKLVSTKLVSTKLVIPVIWCSGIPEVEPVKHVAIAMLWNPCCKWLKVLLAVVTTHMGARETLEAATSGICCDDAPAAKLVAKVA